MKNTLQLLSTAFAIVCGSMISGCSKESDGVTPDTINMAQSSDLLSPGQLNLVPVGGTWNQGPAATGLSDYVVMKLTSHKVTPKGEIDTWIEDKPVPLSIRPLTKLVYNKSFTYVIEGVSYTYQIHCVTETDGTMNMRTNWNLATDRSDDI